MTVDRRVLVIITIEVGLGVLALPDRVLILLKELIESLPSHPKNVPLMLPVSLDFYANHRAKALELYMEMLSE